jgi:hypothetical protein
VITALSQFKPAQNGQTAFLKEMNLINSLLGIDGVWYEVRDGYVVFSEDITDVNGINVNAVDMQLVTMDMDHYGDYDILPLTADMAGQVVSEVLALLMPSPPEDKRVDSTNVEIPQKR